jgi:glucose-1-phosphate cytidylyltransferase
LQAVILAGGLGTRLAEETGLRPKPMVEIGGRPILWHIMKTYSHYGVNDFVILLGYKGYVIKEFFFNYLHHNSDITVDLAGENIKIHSNAVEPWKVTLIDTGEHTMTGGRLKRAADFLDDTFFLTYGDGLSDININDLLAAHEKSAAYMTVTAVYPPARFGMLEINASNKVTRFIEKPIGGGGMINGGYFVVEKKVLDYIDSDSVILEADPLQNLAADNKLSAFKHEGFWQPMDTIRDKLHLEGLWTKNNAPWKVW